LRPMPSGRDREIHLGEDSRRRALSADIGSKAACLARLMPPIASLAFAPLLFRGWFYFVQEPTPLVVRRLGWSELKHATAFCVLLIATFILARQG
jgi:hypothetical protein